MNIREAVFVTVTKLIRPKDLTRLDVYEIRSEPLYYSQQI